MRFKIGLTIAVTLIALVILIVTVNSIYYHEKAHGQIMAFHGCKEVDYGIRDGNIREINFYTDCIEYYNRTEVWILQEEYLHSMNEIIGYHVQALISAGLGIVLVYAIVRK